MDEKTEELRDIFMSVSDDETVTESQTETRGSLAAADEAVDAKRIRETIEELRDQDPFDADLPIETYVDVVRAFYDDAADESIADELDLTENEVFAARLDLHLLRDADTDAPFDLSVLRQHRDADAATLGDDLGVDVETVRHYRRVVAAEDAARAANHRYRREFDELLGDADLSGHVTEGIRDDGLREAAEDIETDVSF